MYYEQFSVLRSPIRNRKRWEGRTVEGENYYRQGELLSRELMDRSQTWQLRKAESY
jgi:hypothetical protein